MLNTSKESNGMMDVTTGDIWFLWGTTKYSWMAGMDGRICIRNNGKHNETGNYINVGTQSELIQQFSGPKTKDKREKNQ